MTKLYQNIKAECYKQIADKTWLVFLSISIIFGMSLTYRQLSKDIFTGIQINANGYNPYYLLNSTSSSIFMLLLLPISLTMCIFVNFKQNENYRTWTFSLSNQGIFQNILGKLISTFVAWACFISVLACIQIVTSLTITKLYPTHFNRYEVNFHFTIIWFLKYYLSSLSAIACCFSLSLLLKNKTLLIIITILFPYLFMFLSRKGYWIPLTYPYFNLSLYHYNYSSYLKGETNVFEFQIIDGYEILSFATLALSILFLYVNRNLIISRLTKA